MSKIQTPYSDGDLPAVSPQLTVDGTPLNITNVSVSTVSQIGATAVWLYSTTPCHVIFSSDSTPATINHAPVCANMPLVLGCRDYDYLSVIKMVGQADGTLWVCPCKEA
jgi:hypothetical protein